MENHPREGCCKGTCEKESLVDLTTGVYQINKSRIVHRGRQIDLDNLELEITSSQVGEMSVFASATITAKIPGLGPDDKDIQVMFEWKDKVCQIEEATVFDVELDPSGTTTLQITGKLHPLSGKAWEDL